VVDCGALIFEIIVTLKTSTSLTIINYPALYPTLLRVGIGNNHKSVNTSPVTVITFGISKGIFIVNCICSLKGLHSNQYRPFNIYAVPSVVKVIVNWVLLMLVFSSISPLIGCTTAGGNRF